MPLINDMQDGSTTLAADRRRPGRLSNINTDLIPIMRGEDQLDLPDEPLVFPEDDELVAAKGMFMGVLLSAPLWACIIFVGHWLLT